MVEFQSVGVTVLLTHCKAALREMIRDSGRMDSIPPNAVFISNHDAVLFCLNETQSGERQPLTPSPLLSTSADLGDGLLHHPVAALRVEEEEGPEAVAVVDVSDVYVVDETKPEVGSDAAGSKTRIDAHLENTKL